MIMPYDKNALIEKNEILKKENGVVKLQVDDIKFDWVCMGSFTTFASIDSIGIKSLLFNYWDNDHHFQGQYLIIKNKKIKISANWKDNNEYLEPGEYAATILFQYDFSEGYSYTNNPNLLSYGTVKINNVKKIDDFYLWVEGTIECQELNVFKADEAKPDNTEPITMHNLKLEINNRCIINK